MHSPGKGNSNFCICDPAGEHVSMRASARELCYIFLCLGRDESLLVSRIWLKNFDSYIRRLENTNVKFIKFWSHHIIQSSFQVPSGHWYAHFDNTICNLAAESYRCLLSMFTRIRQAKEILMFVFAIQPGSVWAWEHQCGSYTISSFAWAETNPC